MSIRSAVTEYLRRRVTLWERRRNERYVSSLPDEIRKDIGWPGGGASCASVGRERDSLLERRW